MRMSQPSKQNCQVSIGQSCVGSSYKANEFSQECSHFPELLDSSQWILAGFKPLCRSQEEQPAHPLSGHRMLVNQNAYLHTIYLYQLLMTVLFNSSTFNSMA